MPDQNIEQSDPNNPEGAESLEFSDALKEPQHFLDYWNDRAVEIPEEKDRSLRNGREFAELSERIITWNPESPHAPTRDDAQKWYRLSGNHNTMYGAEDHLHNAAKIILTNEHATVEQKQDATNMLLEAARLTGDERLREQTNDQIADLTKEVTDWDNDRLIEIVFTKLDMAFEQAQMTYQETAEPGARIFEAQATLDKEWRNLQQQSIQVFEILSKRGASNGKLFELYTLIQLRHAVYSNEQTDTISVRQSYPREDAAWTNRRKDEISDNFDISVVDTQKYPTVLEHKFQLKFMDKEKAEGKNYRKPVIVIHNRNGLTRESMHDNLKALNTIYIGDADPRVKLTATEINKAKEMARQGTIDIETSR